MAVGPQNDTTPPLALAPVYQWNGTSWNNTLTLPVPLGPNPFTGVLYPGQAMSVSCVSSTFCMAVGYSGNLATGFADEWNGSTWSSEPLAVPSGASSYSLFAVDCLSPTYCQAVGEADGPPLNEQWNGTAWSVVPSAASGVGWLYAVSCGDASDCMAVGYAPDGTLASEQWNGSEWTRVSIPNEATGSEAQSLTSVSCPSASSCVAVGWYSFQVTPTSGGEAPIVDSWNGSTWSADQLPISLVAGLDDTFNSVDCYSVGDCVAVGSSYAYNQSSPPVVLSSQNGSWSEVGNSPIDPNGGTDASLSSISCVTGWACVTAGTAAAQRGNDIYFASTSDTTPNVPIPTITSPPTGSVYTPGQVVTTSFSCSDGIGGPGLSSCVDSSGSNSPGSLDTSNVGPHTYSVTATSTDGQSSTASIDYTVAEPPTATINSPAAGGTYLLNQQVLTSFTCSEGAAGPGLSVCVDSNGSKGPDGLLDTSSVGAHSYEVGVLSQDGLWGQTSISYTVVTQLAPSVSISAPASGGIYSQNQVVPTSFTCAEGQGGPGISTCVDSSDSTSPGVLDTSSFGTHAYSVTATSSDGLASTQSLTYTVAAPPTATIASPASGGTYVLNQVVATSFVCGEGLDGPGVSQCLDSNNQASPGHLDTSSTGTHTYSVEAESGDGLSTQTPITYTVVAPNVAPAVTVNPISQTGYAGATLTFTASASGTPTPSVQWQVSTNKGTSWSNAAGATSTSLTTAALTTTESGWEVRAVFTNAAGTATTSAATITVLRDVAPKVTLQPTNKTVRAGSIASFMATASGTPTPTVQWEVSSNFGSTWSNVAGATSTTLSFIATAGQNGWKYRAVFKNGGGSVTTRAATLKVD